MSSNLTALALIATTAMGLAAANQPRTPADDIKSPGIRERAGLLPGTNLLFNGWGVTPAGTPAAIPDMGLKMIVAPDKKTLLAVSAGYNDHGLSLLNIQSREVTQFLPLAEAWNGLAFSKDGQRIFVSGGDSGKIHLFKYADGKATAEPAVKPSTDSPVFLAGIAVHPVTGKIYVCNEANQELWVLNADTLALEKTITVGEFPHSCVIGADNKHIYVSNWGSRTVSIVDLEKNRKLRNITVGLRPNDMALAPDGRLFIACAGDNTVHVIQTKALEKQGPEASPARRLWEGTREVISTSLYPQSPEGSTPDGLAVSPDGKTLFVANADNNSVAVVDISNRLSEQAREHKESVSVVDGFIPTGWYPTSVAVSPDNKTLFVASGKGLTSQPNWPAKTRRSNNVRAFDHIGKTLSGAVSFIDRPDSAKMSDYTAQVRRNSPYTPESLRQSDLKSASVIPAKVGDPCPIKYVLYIIKENRTYDQVLGDLKDAQGKPIGNGEPKLTLYGEKVTPNQHSLAREYVLLDNLYCNGEVSVDGHSWCDAAIATDFNNRSWIMSYSKHGKLPGNEEMENPAAGYLWDLCRRHGLSFKNYGEGAQRVPTANRGRWRADWADGRDAKLVDFWIEDLHQAESKGELPRFTIMSLGENHTKGTTPGAFKPDACVASNDQGLGKIVEAASRSKFWKQMAIFVIEDDAQNGPDHVDAHRTVGFVISPFCKRKFVDSTLYTTASMIRTMELILGLPPLTQYDAGATPMFNSFKSELEETQFTLLPLQIDMNAKNSPLAPFARESSRMNFRVYDRAPEDELNRILWAEAKGPDVPYPAPIHRALFTR